MMPTSLQGPPPLFLTAPRPLPLLEITVPFLRDQDPSIPPCGWKPRTLTAKLPLSAFHSLDTVSASGMSVCPKVTHMGRLC